MITPAVIVLDLGAVLAATAAIFMAVFALQILRHWRLGSGSERQRALERKTDLAAAAFVWVLCYEILSLFLFVRAADGFHRVLTGAMCAAGSLNANPFGYPALVVKLTAALLSGLWLILHHADQQTPEYPLLTRKYRLALVLSLLILTEAGLMIAYFAHLSPKLITSCCNVQFGTGGWNEAAPLLTISPGVHRWLLFGGGMIALAVGIAANRARKGYGLYACLCTAYFPVAVLSMIGFVSPYIYELPTHRCPFCMLQPEYHFIGYGLYALIFSAAVSGMGAAVIRPPRPSGDYAARLPRLRKKLCFWSVIGYAGFLISVGIIIFRTDFRLA